MIKGDIYKSEYEGLYCTPCESFWTETQLVDGKCPDCGREVKRLRKEAYFFKMSKYQDKLMEYIESHPEFIQPESRKNEMVNNFLKPGLQDLCVSEQAHGGIPVEFDPGHIVYVWIDALSNYITALGYTPEERANCIISIGLPMCILSVRIFFVSIQFIGRLCLWHWASHFETGVRTPLDACR